jgi:7-keto-8-aminopelargonate synthetase-like enzyme
VLSDELNHASIIDGCRLSRSALAVYRHRDLEHAEELLSSAANASEAGPATSPTIVVTDTVFSMDGDVAPVDELVSLCARHGALLVLDEAHAVLGPTVPAASAAPIVRVGTLSKTLGSLGGFVAASREVVDLLVNRARPYIFSTAPSPADAGAALAALGVLRSDEGAALVHRLTHLVARAVAAGLAAPGHPSPIIPVVLGSETRALEASAMLLAEGIWVPAIRPPTVPAGTSRLRVTLSAAHRDEDAARLLDALVRLRPPVPATL